MKFELVELNAPLDLKTVEMLVELENEAFGETGLSIYEIPAFALFGKIYIFKADGKPAGHAILARYFEKNSAFLFSFAVSKPFRGKGFSRKFMEMLLEELSSDFDSVFLTVSPNNTPALKTYRSSGFQPVETVKDFYGKGEDRIIMMKILVKEVDV